MVTTVSIIIPFYGTVHSQRLELVTEAILAQKGGDADLIVAGLNQAKRIGGNEDLENLPKENAPDSVKMGRIINNGLRLAKGEFTYVTDADIMLHNKNYLERLVHEVVSDRVSLKRPPMRRLLLQDFEWFCQNVSLNGLENSVKELDFSQNYIVKPKNSIRPMRIFPKLENNKQKIFIASESDFQDYISSKDNKGKEPAFFNQDRHCGAVFSLTEELLKVGGYHEGFVSWGVWDADVQWKLEKQTGIRLIPYQKELEVIHLDHPKGYFSKSKWEQDKTLQEMRRLIGAEECIRKDKEDYLGERNER